MTDTDIVVAENGGWLTPFADWVTPRGLRELPDDLTFEKWEQLGKYIGVVFAASKWALGDWLAFGEHRYGEKYAQAAAATGRSEQGLMNIASTSRAWPLETRVADYGIHEELKTKAREDIGSAQKLVVKAVREKLTREELRAELRPAVETKKQVAASVTLTVDEFEAEFEVWKAAGHYNAYRTRGAAMMAAFIKHLRKR